MKTKNEIPSIKRGWWKFSWECIDDSELTELSDYTLEHIAEMIKQGYTEGEIIEEE